MPNLVGIDGCRLGWTCIFEELPSRYLASRTLGTIDDLAKHIATFALWTAERIQTGTAVIIPENPLIDSEGLSMRMVY